VSVSSRCRLRPNGLLTPWNQTILYS